ncbi:hypothetical protein FNP_0238 [Fusobacterium polymorphum ATCC 10953]|uniref:Uncharacterized protein n=1 Tax=Fusobacterium polymorphum ATCC 10953 TaxID=393480 RepID=A5TT28_FUSNP|nr:hypothetical protein FNP_0238 [Fusobacterium polymorphum ATCC 10953]
MYRAHSKKAAALLNCNSFCALLGKYKFKEV